MCYLPYVHLGYQALALDYMSSIRGYYCLLGSRLFSSFFVLHLQSCILQSCILSSFLLGYEAKIVGHDERHHTVAHVSYCHSTLLGQTYA